jgi:hypothetical protein
LLELLQAKARDRTENKMASHFTAKAGTYVTNNVLANNEEASKFS